MAALAIARFEKARLSAERKGDPQQDCALVN
jgi:hypothetical protein